MINTLNFSRRRFVSSAASAVALASSPAMAAFAPDPIAPYRTPYKYPELLLRGTGHKGDFDERSVDDPIVFRARRPLLHALHRL